jgi:proteasome accessory factor A
VSAACFSTQAIENAASGEAGPGYAEAMTVRRVMGTETEYGIAVPGQTAANHMLASSQIVNAYLNATTGIPRDRSPRWDFEEESPLRDARGFEVAGQPPVSREAADVLPDDEVGLANVILTNGARLYVDHAHPEYSTPEVTNPRDAVIWDKAGELVMVAAAEFAARIPGAGHIQLYKNNTDNKGASYGSHENYLMRRQTPFAEIVRHLTPFFVTRQVVCGAGRVGIGQDGHTHGFQISQRADFFEVEVGLETTLKRPIINTRDEPHADPERYRRLHVIIGDANMSELSSYLKLGTTSLVLSMIEEGWFNETGVDLTIEAPVAALRAVSHDWSLRHTVSMKDGRSLTGLQVQAEYLEQARKFVESRYGADADEQTLDVLDRWERTLARLTDDPMSLADELDWVAKLSLLQGYRDREGLDWNAHKLQLVDLQYSDVRPDKGLYNRLVARGRMKRLIDDPTIEAAVTEPPTDTRAYFRGNCLAKYAADVAAASWDSVIFDVGRDSLQRVPMLEPLRGTKAHVEELLARCDTAAQLVDEIAGPRTD